MHKELAKDGLVVMTLSVDDKDGEKAALEFLQESKATFPNLILDDTDENKDKFEKVLAHTAVPIIHVFDRSGKKVKTFDKALKGDELDVLVKDLLKQK